MPPEREVPRGLFYCSNCGHQGIFRWVYTLDQIAYLLGSKIEPVKMAISSEYMKFRYRLRRGKLEKIVTLPFFLQYIDERLPTPEALRSTDLDNPGSDPVMNNTMQAILKIVNWKKGMTEKRVATRKATLAKKKAREEREQRSNNGRDEMG